MLALTRLGRPSAPRMAGRPRTNASHGHRACRRPAGPLEDEHAVRAVAQRRSAPKRPGAPSAGRARDASPARRRVRPAVGVDERARPGLVGADLPLEVGRRSARVEPAVLAPERAGQRRRRSAGCGRRRQLAARATARGSLRAARRASVARRASSSGAVLVAASGRPGAGRRAARVEARRPSASG